MILEKRLAGKMGRAYIEAISEEDRRHNINSKGSLALNNAYGEIIYFDENKKKEFPIICGHGGSMWLCRACKDKILKDQHQLQVNHKSTIGQKQAQ